jgi:hypothetical protein
MFGKWTVTDGHASGYGTVSPPSYTQEPQPPAFGYEPPTAAVHEFKPTCCTCQQGPMGDQVREIRQHQINSHLFQGLPGDDGTVIIHLLFKFTRLFRVAEMVYPVPVDYQVEMVKFSLQLNYPPSLVKFVSPGQVYSLNNKKQTFVFSWLCWIDWTKGNAL